MRYVSSHVINYQHVSITFVHTIRVALKEQKEVCRFKYSMFETFLITLSGSQYPMWQIIVLCKATPTMIAKLTETYW